MHFEEQVAILCGLEWPTLTHIPRTAMSLSLKLSHTHEGLRCCEDEIDPGEKSGLSDLCSHLALRKSAHVFCVEPMM